MFDVADWAEVRTFPAATLDLSSLSFSRDGGHLVVADTQLRYLLLIYTIEGDLLFRYQAYEHALGIRSLAWSPDGSFLCVGDYCQSARLINTLSWKVVCEYAHTHPFTHARLRARTQRKQCRGRGLDFNLPPRLRPEIMRRLAHVHKRATHAPGVGDLGPAVEKSSSPI